MFGEPTRRRSRLWAQARRAAAVEPPTVNMHKNISKFKIPMYSRHKNKVIM
jgi:hypothetical protein